MTSKSYKWYQNEYKKNQYHRNFCGNLQKHSDDTVEFDEILLNVSGCK